MKINAENMHYKDLNDAIKAAEDKEIIIENAIGHRYIGCGTSGKDIKIHGVPGNALGAYLNSSKITVYANAQDATGDTMNSGEIIIHGNCGDALGYGMRNGKILVKGTAGYRCGIHMKAYEDLQPVIVIGKSVGDFLGEYQAGGKIIVLGIDCDNKAPVGNFCGTGMHGGEIFIRSDVIPESLPAQVSLHDALAEDLAEIRPIVEDFCNTFGYNADELLSSHFFKLTPNTKNPYKQLYVHN